MKWPFFIVLSSGELNFKICDQDVPGKLTNKR
jgi:hypothetical protein